VFVIATLTFKIYILTVYETV